jgi:hypothetical protein
MNIEEGVIRVPPQIQRKIIDFGRKFGKLGPKGKTISDTYNNKIVKEFSGTIYHRNVEVTPTMHFFRDVVWSKKKHECISMKIHLLIPFYTFFYLKPISC